MKTVYTEFFHRDESYIRAVGQNHIHGVHTVYIRYFWQGNRQMYGHIRFWPTLYIRFSCTVSANPRLKTPSAPIKGTERKLLLPDELARAAGQSLWFVSGSHVLAQIFS